VGDSKLEEGGRWCAARRRGNRPGPSQAVPPRAAGGVRRGSRRRRRFPRARGRWRGAPVRADPAPRPTACAPFRGCASAPRPWLRAGGGKTRRKSCASAANSGASAAPGAVRCQATRPQIATNEINQSIVLPAKDPCHPLERLSRDAPRDHHRGS